jgi:choline dehydrogenase-like flavoprotein
MDKTYLRVAAARGARIIVECVVERILIAAGRATGVIARSRPGHDVTVRARIVVGAAGGLQSPALLLRSGVSSGVGRRLTLHPATAVWGRFDREVRPWAGTVQSLHSEEFAAADGRYGVRLATTPMHPAFVAFAAPWEGRTQFDELACALPYLSTVGVVLRDRIGGRVRVTRGGRVVIDYRVSRYDQRHLRLGIQRAASVLAAAGASEVISSQCRVIKFRPGRGEGVERWLGQVDTTGYGANQMFYFSFNQMGTCRMGLRSAGGVVDEDGQTYAVRDLYVADASVFPTASGVNPMMTIAALAYHISQRIKARHSCKG